MGDHEPERTRLSPGDRIGPYEVMAPVGYGLEDVRGLQALVLEFVWGASEGAVIPGCIAND
jgi:hypothetical protein